MIVPIISPDFFLTYVLISICDRLPLPPDRFNSQLICRHPVYNKVKAFTEPLIERGSIETAIADVPLEHAKYMVSYYTLF